MLSINTNLSSLIAQSSMKQSTSKLNQAIERMTTGFKINHASDNAANYSISTNMTTKIGAYNVAEDNVSIGLDMIATAESTLNQIQDKLERLRALQEQANNGTYGEESLNAINAEANALVDEINRLYSTAEYNGLKLFGGSTEGGTDAVSAAYLDNPISGYSLMRSTGSSTGFLQQITRRDTSEMASFASVDENSDLVDGTYSISTPEELIKLSDMTFAGFISEGDEFVLANDIDMSSTTGFNGIATNLSGTNTYFRGTFDGNGYMISNCSMYTSRGGLFGYVSGVIKNLAVSDSNMEGTLMTGGLVAVLINGTIINCYTKNVTVSCIDNSCGGLVGEMDSNSTVLYSYAEEINITDADDFAGGLVGDNAGTIDSCYANGHVNPYYTGAECNGLVGNNTGNVTNSYSTTTISGTLSSTGINNSDDWDGTTFTLYQPVGDTTTPDTPTITPPSFTPAPDTIVLQIGASSDWASQVGVSTKFDLDGVDDLRLIGIDLTTDYLTQIDDMLALVSEKQTHFGAVSNRLESVLEEIVIQRDNLISSRSTIRDADIAKVSSTYIQQQILQQASATLLATANQSPSIALQLI